MIILYHFLFEGPAHTFPGWNRSYCACEKYSCSIFHFKCVKNTKQIFQDQNPWSDAKKHTYAFHILLWFDFRIMKRRYFLDASCYCCKDMNIYKIKGRKTVQFNGFRQEFWKKWKYFLFKWNSYPWNSCDLIRLYQSLGYCRCFCYILNQNMKFLTISSRI